MSRQEQAKKIMERFLNELDAIGFSISKVYRSGYGHEVKGNFSVGDRPSASYEIISFKTNLKRLEHLANKAKTEKKRP